jgi:hypothetical protein
MGLMAWHGMRRGVRGCVCSTVYTVGGKSRREAGVATLDVIRHTQDKPNHSPCNYQQRGWISFSMSFLHTPLARLEVLNYPHLFIVFSLLGYILRFPAVALASRIRAGACSKIVLDPPRCL